MEKGDKAPEFSLPDENGREHKLSDYKQSWVLLYFYPKDFTSGCTKEACTLRDNFSELNKKSRILGVSADSVSSHKKFSQTHSLPFPLLSDPERKVIKMYGATGFVFAKRVSFLIGPEGNIEKIYNKVDPKVHAKEVLEDLEKLQS